MILILGQRDFMNLSGAMSARHNQRSASTDIFHRQHDSNTFWQSMVNLQRVNNWNENYTPSRSRDRSAPATGLLANFGSSTNERSSSRIGFGGGAPRFGNQTPGNRSTTNSVSRGRNNENDYGVWGKKSTQEYYQNRDSSPAFGAARVRAIKEDLETTS